VGPVGPAGPPGTDGTNGTDAQPLGNYITGTKLSDLIDSSFWDAPTPFADIIIGKRGNDTILGGDGNDFISGGKGADHLIGGHGDDVVLGGRGHDTFVFAAGDGHDKWRFTTKDIIDLSGTGIAKFGDLHMTQTAQGVVLDLGGGDSVLLAFLHVNQLHASEFHF
jgi:Ca2+-binding RTX toxin-like protein